MVLPKSMRIKGHKCFNYIHKTANKYNAPLMLLKVADSNPKLVKEIDLRNSSQDFRCAISISNKVSKKAVDRNKIRRAFHEHLKRKYERRTPNQRKWLLLSLKPGPLNKNLYSLLREFDKLLSKAGF